MINTTQLAKVVFASSFVFYFKASVYHWNVEGRDFPMLHEFFGSIYQEVYGSIDKFAEEIRSIGDYAPRSINEIQMYSAVHDSSPLTGLDMVADLKTSNDVILDGLNSLFVVLEGNPGFQDFISTRIDAHKKHAWMLSSTLK